MKAGKNPEWDIKTFGRESETIHPAFPAMIGR